MPDSASGPGPDYIPLARPDVRFDDVAEDLRAILDSGRLTGGPYVLRFEQTIADAVGVRRAVATSSGSAALHLALLAAGVGPGDEVLVSDFSFPASGNAIVHTGATPVLVDCLPGRFDLDPDDAARRITPRTRAILPVDPFGLPAALGRVHALATAHGLTVIEDAACALGARSDGRPCGGWPGAGCFSFHPRKVPTSGEGGMVTTDDDALADRVARLRNHGGVPGDLGMTFEESGFNARMSELHAALGLAQLPRLPAILASRRSIAARYAERLADVRGLTLPLSSSPDSCAYQSFVVLLDEEIDRDRCVALLDARAVASTLGTYAMHAQPAFSRFGYAPGDLPHSWRAQRQSLALPLLPEMDHGLVDRVVDALVESLPLAAR